MQKINKLQRDLKIKFKNESLLIKNLYDKLRFFPNPNPILPIKSDN